MNDLDYAKKLIAEYYIEEFNESENDIEFIDLTAVGLAYTTWQIESSNEEIEVESVVDLVECKLYQYINNKAERVEEFKNLKELINEKLVNLDFNDLTDIEWWCKKNNIKLVD